MSSPRVPDDRAGLPLTAGGGSPTAGTGRPTAGAGPTAAGPAATGPAAPQPEVSFFEAVGGEPTFRRLVEVFYAGVASDPLLRPMYPEEDLGPAAERLTLFLVQYWGGPNTYSAQRGHPRLRMRHAPFRVGAAERDAWLRHMHDAVRALELPPAYEEALWQYLERAAYFMVNTMDEMGQAG